jgi:hypothetical protein
MFAHRFFFVAPLFAAAVLAQPSTARACGGCFHEPPGPNQTVSVVTDHRMAFSISPTQTTLWDQIEYSGDPKSFAWVLPVGQGATIELARNEWLATLAAMTAPAIYAPPLPSCYGNTGGGGMSCGCSADEASDSADGGVADAATKGGVQVISQGVVGPYDTVTLRSSNGDSISQWLVANGYVIQPQIQPILDAYTNEGFDFIALKLAPDQGVQAMQPVRVTTPGADPSLPLRMIAAGAGSSVGLELYVISAGRYETKNFPAMVIDPTAVVWDPNQSTSNYTTLFQSAVANGGWVTEFSGALPQLLQTYKAQCTGLPSTPVSCSSDAGDEAGDDASTDASPEASTDDASTTDDASSDAESDASDADASCTQYASACTLFTDFDKATNGLDPYDVTITRLRTSLPASALNVDLQIGAGPQTTVSNVIKTTAYSDPNYDPCAGLNPPPKRGAGCDTASERSNAAATCIIALALVGLVRRRTRRA